MIYDMNDNDFYVFPKLCVIHFNTQHIERERDDDHVYRRNIFRINRIGTSYARYYGIYDIFLDARVLQSLQTVQNSCKFDGALLATIVEYGNYKFSMIKYYRNTRCVKTTIQLVPKIRSYMSDLEAFQLYCYGSPINDRTIKDYTNWFTERCDFYNVHIPNFNLPVKVEEYAN